jgi:hypothetical protein
VSDDRRHIQNAGLAQHLNRRDAPLFDAGLRLLHRFRRVDVNADTQLLGMSHGRPQEIVVAGIWRVRSHPGADAAIGCALPAGDKIGAVSQ